jgi:hypothetical protein
VRSVSDVTYRGKLDEKELELAFVNEAAEPLR